MLEENSHSLAPPAIPSGTVTFLFTDIEGSTKLLEKLRQEYAVLLEEQREVLRASFSRWNGHEIDTQGDSFFAAFPTALEAVNCVIEAQRELAGHAWPQGASVRVRMGLHTGEPLVARTGYVGMDVHRAARIAASGYGGQVLVSQATRELIYQDLPQGVSLVDLGEYRLKDIRYPQRIYQLNLEGLPGEFPALKTLSAAEEPPTPGEVPYQGLLYFNESDAGWFFGREVVTARLVEAAQSKRFLAVIGASGSGKSSVVRAGLVPSLKRLQAGRWQVFVLTPTAHPLEALAVSLTRGEGSISVTAGLIDDLQRDSRSLHLYLLQSKQAGGILNVLIVVDQFEELFTQCREAGERQAFIDNLLYAAKADGGAARIVIALRADFYEYVAQHPELREAVAAQQIYIGAMSAEELRQAIEGPANRGGWELSPGLAELMLHDIGAGEDRQPEPGALPLLSHALLETWKRRRGNLLSLRAYTEAGGVRGAIAHTADSVYNLELSSEQQEIARAIFLRLTELGEGTQDTRRRISLQELIPPGPALETEQIRAVLLKLADARLITTGENTVEVAHEALIREWPALREWLSQDREGLRLHRHLTESAHEWELLERDPGALYRGARLAQAVEWALNNPRQLNLQEQAFLHAAQEAAEREAAEREAARQRELEAAQKLAEAEHQRAEEQAQAARRLRQRAAYLAIALVVAMGLAAAALFFFNRASQNADLAAERQAEAESNADLAAASAAHARQQQALAEGESQARATQQAIAEQERARAELRAREAYARELSQAAETNLERDPELSMLLALEAISISQAANLPVSSQMQDMLHRAMQGARARLTLTHPGGAWGIDVSPDGELLATAGNDGTVRLWDAQTGQPVQTLTGHTKVVGDVSFSPDGKYLASAGDDATARIWDLASGATILTLNGGADPITFVAYSPDGTRLATSGWDTQTDTALTRVWDISAGENSGQMILELPGEGENVAFSPDSARLATSNSTDEKVRIWEVASGKELLSWPVYSSSLAFSTDGSRLAFEGPEFGQVSVFDTATEEPVVRMCCHAAGVRAIDFTRDGSLIATAGQEGVAKVWDANSGRELSSLSGQIGPVDDLAFSPECAEPPAAPFAGCGRYVYTAGRSGVIKKWDVSPAGERDLLTAQSMIAAFFPGGEGFELLNLNPPNQAFIQTWRTLPGGEPELVDVFSQPPLVERITAGDQASSPGKTRVAIAGLDGSVQTWEAGRPQQMISYTVPISTSERVTGVFIVPDGLRLATHTGQGDIQIWDVAAGEILLSVPAEGGRVDLSPDGRSLAIGGSDGSVSLWEADSGEKLRAWAAHAQPVIGLAFSPDGTRLATGSLDTTARVWDLESGNALFSVNHNASAYFPIFSPDGKRLAVNQTDGSLYLWDVDEASPTAGQLLFKFSGLDEFAAFNGFSPDGKIVFVGGYFGQKIRLYLLPLEDLAALARSRLTRGWMQEEYQRYRIEPCPVGE